MAPIITQSYPIQYKGRVFSYVITTEGETGLVESWDVIHRGLEINKATPEELQALGLTVDDVQMLMVKGKHIIDSKEGRELGSSGPLY